MRFPGERVFAARYDAGRRAASRFGRDRSLVGGTALRGLGALCGLVLASVGAHAVESASPPAMVGIDPYYTGSLLSPSPASSQAGLLAFEPYVIYTSNPKTYGPNGGVSTKADRLSSLGTLTLFKYGITDNLSIQVIPTSSIDYDARGFDSGSYLGDTSAELEYLLTRQDKKTGKPAISASVGFDFPTGRYQNLFSSVDGSGNGTCRLRLGLLAQSLLYGESQHPIRIRLYANGAIPVSDVSVRGFSTFGSDNAFVGRATSGTSGSVGGSVEYSISQRLVFALDVYHGFSTSSHYYGFETTGGFTNVDTGNSDTTQIAPALEYSFNGYFGIIAGASFSVAGRNASTVLQPQIAFNYVFDTTKPDFGLGQILSNK